MRQGWEEKREQLDVEGTEASYNPTGDLRWGWPLREVLNQGTGAGHL